VPGLKEATRTKSYLPELYLEHYLFVQQIKLKNTSRTS